MNGLGGNHSPLVGLRAQPLKHTPREKYVEDGGQEAGEEAKEEKRGTKMMNKRSEESYLLYHMYICISLYIQGSVHFVPSFFSKLLSTPAAMDMN